LIAILPYFEVLVCKVVIWGSRSNSHVKDGEGCQREGKGWFVEVYLESWAERLMGVLWPFVNGIEGAGAARAGQAELGGLLAVERC
jgi:hypothetical protein